LLDVFRDDDDECIPWCHIGGCECIKYLSLVSKCFILVADDFDERNSLSRESRSFFAAPESLMLDKISIIRTARLLEGMFCHHLLFGILYLHIVVYLDFMLRWF